MIRPSSLAIVLAVACGGGSTPPSANNPTHGGAEPRACTEIGCDNGLMLNFLADSGWQPGNYRVVVDVDGQPVSCHGSLPLPACESGGGFQCDSPDVRLGESGCALPPEQQGLSDIHLETTSATEVSVTIERDGQLMATTVLKPSFQRVQPNGPDCPPVCTTAAINLPLTRTSPPAETGEGSSKTSPEDDAESTDS